MRKRVVLTTLTEMARGRTDAPLNQRVWQILKQGGIDPTLVIHKFVEDSHNSFLDDLLPRDWTHIESVIQDIFSKMTEDVRKRVVLATITEMVRGRTDTPPNQRVLQILKHGGIDPTPASFLDDLLAGDITPIQSSGELLPASGNAANI